MAKLLLLNGESVQVVCMSRALHKLGHEVSSLSHTKCSSGYTTRWVDHKYMCPEPVTHAEEFRKCFYEHIKEHQYDLIIPMLDEGADFLSREKERIEGEYGIPCAIPSYDIFDLANDKQKLMELCKKYDLPHPRTEELPSPKVSDGFSVSAFQEQLKAVADYVGFPAMIKPNISAGAKGIVRVDSLEELEEKFPGIEKKFGKCTLQQYVVQPDYYYNVMLYRDKKGNYPAYTIIKIRRYFPLKGGSSCYSETVEQPELLDSCKVMLEKLGWTGFADIDVLVDKNSGELKIIEINPRTPSSFQASFAAGVNFAEIFVTDYLGGSNVSGVSSVQKEYPYHVGRQVRWFGLDAMWFVFSKDRFRFKPSWLKFWGKNVSYHDGSWNDPLPMIAGILAGVVKYLNPEFRKAKLKG